MKRRNPASIVSQDYEQNGIKYRLSVRPTMKGFAAWWACAVCGQIGSKFAGLSISRAQQLARENVAEHVCNPPDQ